MVQPITYKCSYLTEAAFSKGSPSAPVDEFVGNMIKHSTCDTVRACVRACVAKCHSSPPTLPTGNYLRSSGDPPPFPPIIGIFPTALKGTVRVPIKASALLRHTTAVLADSSQDSDSPPGRGSSLTLRAPHTFSR